MKSHLNITPYTLAMLTVWMGSSAMAQISIDSLVPNSANPGDNNVSVTATLSGTLPPAQVQPTAFEIGTLSGFAVSRPNSTEVTATFSFPANMPESVYNVTITFPSPNGDLPVMLANGFTLGNAAPPATNGLVSRTGYSYPGYTLFAPIQQTTTYLIDQNGNVAHTWESSYSVNLSAYLMDDGSILRAASDAGTGLVERIDIDNNVVWSWTPSVDSNLKLHHDIEPLPNGNVLMIAYDVITAAEAISAGRDPSLLSTDELWSESIIEVEPNGANGGTIVWRWNAWDHLVQDYLNVKSTNGKSTNGAPGAHPELIDLNYVLNTDEDWLHFNGIDYNAELDQIVVSSRSLSEIWIIDHSSSTAEAGSHSGGNGGRGGDLLYRWGNPQVYDAGDANDQTFFGQHNPQWIDSSYPGGGNILVFNNGQGRTGGDYSSVDEIVPPLNGYNYTLTPGSAWGPSSATWTYVAPNPTDFYADHISGTQRLPDGNTLICHGTAGEIFEVTPSGDIVWDYINPYIASTPQGDSNQLFRATRYDLDADPIIALGLNKTGSNQYSYPIVDSAQVLCYNNTSEIIAPASGEAFYGQDAQYFGYQPSYTISADGLTVRDNITRLVWVKDPDLNGDGVIDVNDKLSADDAELYPATLNAINYGGYNDWRLPSVKEQYSLMDFSGATGMDAASSKPYLDTAYFDFAFGDESAGERYIDSQWATTTRYVSTVFGGSEAMFGNNFADGRIKGYGLSDPGTGGEKLFYVRCVRGNPDYGINDFVDNGDDTVTDLATGLMWQQDDSGTGKNWEEALAYVEQMNAANYLGHSDWRLPNIKELQSLTDYTRSPDTTNSAAIDPIFNVTPITDEGGSTNYPFYWSGTTHVENEVGTYASYVCFGEALGFMEDPMNPGTYNLQDVHGAGAQRSDPKEGNPADYPNGHGPQGDVIRIYNFVRLVRDADIAPTPTVTSDQWAIF